MNNLRIVFLNPGESIEDAKYIRTKVFQEEQGIDKALDFDIHDQFSTHVIVYDDKKPVGTGRIRTIENGKVKNTQRMKLLLALMWADKMGRKPEDTIMQSIEKNANFLTMSSKRSSEQKPITVNQPFFGSPEEMNSMLKTKFVDQKQRFNAIKKKFHNLSDEEIQKIL